VPQTEWISAAATASRCFVRDRIVLPPGIAPVSLIAQEIVAETVLVIAVATVVVTVRAHATGPAQVIAAIARALIGPRRPIVPAMRREVASGIAAAP
jgi:hypothetical protein